MMLFTDKIPHASTFLEKLDEVCTKKGISLDELIMP